MTVPAPDASQPTNQPAPSGSSATPAAPASGDAPPAPPAAGGGSGSSASASTGTPTTLSELLEKYRKEVEDGLKELEKLEPLKASIADKAQRIQALEKAIEGKDTAAAAYRDFHDGIEVFKSEIESFIDTVRSQLALTDAERKLVEDAIAAVDQRVAAARDARDAQVGTVDEKQEEATELDGKLALAKKRSDFLKSGLQQRVTKQRDDLKALKQQADAAKDRYEAAFYLSEMKAMVPSGGAGAAAESDPSDAAYADDLDLVTFLSEWEPDEYGAEYERWLAELNDAENGTKQVKVELADARKRAADLDKAAKDAEAKRRDSILKELKKAVAASASAPASTEAPPVAGGTE